MDSKNNLRSFLKQSQQTTENLGPTGQTSGKDNETRVRTRHSSHSLKKCASESLEHSDELVKYMSKLPGYLQRIELGQESFGTSNVLNVGVLDWGRLEKWKHCRAREIERKVSTVASTSTSGTLPNESHRCEIDDQVNTCSNLGKGKVSRDLQHSVHAVRCTLEPELASRDTLNNQETATCSYKSSDIDHEEANPFNIRRLRSDQESAFCLSTEMGNSVGSLRMKERQNRSKEIHLQEARERPKENGKQCGVKLDGEEKIIGDSKEHEEVSNIVLFRSRKQSQRTLSGEHQMSLDDNMRIAREVNRSLDFSDGTNNSLKSRTQIPGTCPVPYDLERESEDLMLPFGVDISCKKERFGGRRHTKTASRIFDLEIPEDESRKNKSPSPSKRFSFSFGRLSRSFTFKEDSSAQPLSSSDDAIKSDSMRFDGSVCPSQSSNMQCGSRVSPLRRLLDPLLKSKGSENVLPPKERSSSSKPKPTKIEVHLQGEKKQDTSRTQALLRLTIRNGTPLFQFVVDDNNDKNKKKSSRSVLGARMETSASLFKDDSDQYCTFFSVNEVKKKKSGSWIHGHKEKESKPVCNVIGQMRLTNLLITDFAEQKSGNISAAMAEAVLFDETEQVKGRSEVAAIVIEKKPIEETLVIIPGGVHSIPEGGAPSPLISRWRSGGLCDCGGWDVGCKLHVLSNKTHIHEFGQSFKLSDQGGSEKESGPALEMTEVKTGIYMVEYGSLLSNIQAFFVCVTKVITRASEEESVSKATVISSSPFAPPLSPVGRV
ncbi:unnamed protein product [Cochlearia groenlandica]